ncbi:carboxylesterase family protein [Leifsonia shinshuensis]|uniref:carboxylesterase/lipase family protein n=1 Tax=Leifsonia shinshuensis TaxID=150026 RepID=UPI001F5113C4|nr:carboxylesterase family protein [Leifsonia shinshuensis]MCI0158048.1 carboxylesterase family protein [Leifsonia shinshuensis]
MPYFEIHTDSGALRGMDDGDVRSLLGVPYGASTGGANRFRAPQPVEPWSGVRDALAFGPSAPQVDTRTHASANGPRTLALLYPRGGWPVEAGSTDEDCLRLNVWAPSDRSLEGLPVLVWLHGGGFTHGSGNEMTFNGDVLARAGGMVVVTVTHRLGILGFLDLRDRGLADSADAGMLDIVAALQWVQRNIGEVGGDPERVTVCGQSGGSVKVATLHGMPAAKDLFTRAVMMSGPFTTAVPAAASEQVRDRALSLLVGPATVDELRTLPVDALLDAQAVILAQGAAARFGAGALDSLPGFAPSIDSVHLPADPFADPELSDGKELMIGWTAHEAGLLLVDDETYTTGLTPAQAVRLLDEDEPGEGERLYGRLSAQHPAEPPHLLWSRRISERIFRDPAVALVERLASDGKQVWTYQFDQTTEVLGGLLGACHSLDLSYVFGTVDRIPLTGRDPRRIDVSRDMMAAWAAFAHSGNPGWEAWAAGNAPHRFGGDADGVHDIDIAAPVRALIAR